MRSPAQLSLIIIDIDFFKEYNDFYGHIAGDACIKQIAQTLRRALPRTAATRHAASTWAG